MRHFGDRDDAAAGFVIGVGQLHGAGGFGQDQVVRQQDGERVIADEGAGAPDGVAEAERFLLADGDHGAGRQLPFTQHAQLGVFATAAEGGLEFVGDIEMFDDRGFAATGDQAELLDPGGAGFLDRVLDQRLVHHRQHFLGHRLGGGQEARAETGNRKNGFAQGLGHGLVSFDWRAF